MENTTHYTAEILRALQTLPVEALPKVLRLLTLVREEFLTQEPSQGQKEPRPPLHHTRTRRLLASSQSNWAQELSHEREDRL